MRVCLLSGNGLSADSIFKLDSPGNRDGCYEPYNLLSRKFIEYGFEIHTSDWCVSEPAFNIHMDVLPRENLSPTYLLLLESSIIQPRNRRIPKYYRKIFTWNDELVDDQLYIKCNYPNSIAIPRVDGFINRDLLCCMIAGNKAAALKDDRELYTERIKAIRWFESNAPEHFALYGVDWDLPQARPGIIGKLERRLSRGMSSILRSRPFTSYRGKITHKREVLIGSRFSLCYENVRDLSGYITEKIFDSFFAGCVPVYWGANNIKNYIPPKCFIDRRDFTDTAEVYAYLKSMDELTYISYQEEIVRFLNGPAAKPFSAEVFAETIVTNIIQDLHGTQ